jgi:SAM-dependent methyltransferase
MALLRRRRRPEMFALVAREIGGLSVLDLCCGDGELRRWAGEGGYAGVDKNPVFAEALRARGVAVVEGDALAADWPAADCVVIIDSLYHFLPEPDRLLEKIGRHPCRRAVVCESVENLSMSPRPLLARLAAWATRVDGRAYPGRFTEDGLRALLARHGFAKMVRLPYNLLAVLDKP